MGMGLTTDISKLRMAPVRIDPTRKPSGDTGTIMVRCHRDQYNALQAAEGRHADQIRCWHEAWLAQTETQRAECAKLTEGENNE